MIALSEILGLHFRKLCLFLSGQQTVSAEIFIKQKLGIILKWRKLFIINII